jgi:hypothetical protein
VKYPIPDQTAYVGLNFNYTIPDSTFFDDDGYNTLSFRATLNNGSPLPQWLSFDSLTCTFTGTPASIANINIKVTATDTAGASVSASMKLVVQLPESVEKKIDEGIRIYPNPTAGMINISLDPAKYRSAKVEICDFQGRSLHSETFSLKTTIDWSDRPRGIYFLRLQSESISVCKKVILE